MVIGAFIGLFTYPHLWWVWFIIIWNAWANATEKKTLKPQPFLSAYEEAAKRWNQELNNWNQRTGATSFLNLKQELLGAKDGYLGLIEDEKRLIQSYRIERRNKHLHDFLDKFPIGSARIKGIGPAREAVLTSYGIDTAADVNPIRLLNLPGFGEATAKPLLVWRASLEQRFVYQANENDYDRREMARIRSSIEAKLAPLRTKLSVGATNLKSLLNRISTVVNTDDSSLNQFYAKKLQAKIDLDFLGIQVPNIPTPTTTSTVRPVSPTKQTIQHSTRPVPGKQTSVFCPRCGSQMIQRRAGRGRNAGNYFWGCSRYPTCKGTRNI
jgi:predicted RNA-binding Zn-ribbon protein involved in translation (DUF1610 family)